MIAELINVCAIIVPSLCFVLALMHWRYISIFNILLIGMFAVANAIAHASELSISHEIRDVAVIVWSIMMIKTQQDHFS